MQMYSNIASAYYCEYLENFSRKYCFPFSFLFGSTLVRLRYK